MSRVTTRGGLDETENDLRRQVRRNAEALNVDISDLQNENAAVAWVIELKMTRQGENAGQTAEKALTQIQNMGYADRFEAPVMLGLAIDTNQRQITEFRDKNVFRR
jgi:hypothetical protein